MTSFPHGGRASFFVFPAHTGDLCCLVVVDYINPSRREVAGRLLEGDILYGLGLMI